MCSFFAVADFARAARRRSSSARLKLKNASTPTTNISQYTERSSIASSNITFLHEPIIAGEYGKQICDELSGILTLQPSW
jgi:hypothetical protein